MKKLLIWIGAVVAVVAVATFGFTSGTFASWSAMGGIAGDISREEVARLTSPTGEFDAVAFEGNGGATTSFWYEVHVVRAGEELPAMDTLKGSDAAAIYLYGARTMLHYGLMLDWPDADHLSVGVLSAQTSRLHKPTVSVAGHTVSVELRENIAAAGPPAGGIIYVCCPERHVVRASS
jgi:hypothetical protein